MSNTGTDLPQIPMSFFADALVVGTNSLIAFLGANVPVKLTRASILRAILSNKHCHCSWYYKHKIYEEEEVACTCFHAGILPPANE